MGAPKTVKRFVALLVTLALVVVTNYAISFAGGIPQLPTSPRPVTLESGINQLPHSPRP